MLAALDFWLEPTQEIVIADGANTPDIKQMVKLIHHKFLPNTVVLLHEKGNKIAAIEQIIPSSKNQTTIVCVRTMSVTVRLIKLMIFIKDFLRSLW